MTKRMRSRIDAVEMSFLFKVTRLSLIDRVRSSVLQEELKVKSLILCIKISQMKSDQEASRAPHFEGFHTGRLSSLIRSLLKRTECNGNDLVVSDFPRSTLC